MRYLSSEAVTTATDLLFCRLVDVGEEAHTILYGKHNCHYIDCVSEDYLIIVSGDGTELKRSDNFICCRNCMDADDEVFPESGVWSAARDQDEKRTVHSGG